MTRPPEDQPTMWFKQVPNNSPASEGIWRQHILPNHHTVCRTRERPKATVDAVALQDLKVAAEKLVGHLQETHKNMAAWQRLRDAVLEMEKNR